MLASNFVKKLALCILEKGSSAVRSCNVGALLPDLNDLGLGKCKVYRSAFQPLSKDLPTRLAHLRVL